MSDEKPPVIQPPSTHTVFDVEKKPLLYLPDGRPLYRQIGFRVPTRPEDKDR